MITEQYW